MRSFGPFLTLLAVGVVSTYAFAPIGNTVASGRATQAPLKMGVFEEQEREALTRDTEPEDYFQT
eukprot:scaffold1900_cov123-Cylindrotheca_fusiformis.AAC.44